MQLITFLGMFACFVALGLKFTAASQRRQPLPPLSRRFKNWKLIVGALIAFLGISLQLRQLNHSLDHSTPYEPSFFERIVKSLSK